MATTFTTDDVTKIAGLANIPVTAEEKKNLSMGFTKTIKVVELLGSVDVTTAKDVHITGLTNIVREDEVDSSRMFTQEEALKNAKSTSNGYFVVNRLIDEE